MVWRIIGGAILCIIGFVMVKKPLLALDLIGRLPLAEKVIGNSTGFYKLLGVIIIIVGFLLITNLHGQVINWVLGFLY